MTLLRGPEREIKTCGDIVRLGRLCCQHCIVSGMALKVLVVAHNMLLGGGKWKYSRARSFLRCLLIVFVFCFEDTVKRKAHVCGRHLSKDVALYYTVPCIYQLDMMGLARLGDTDTA